MRWTYNLQEALRRLGIKEEAQPDLNTEQVMAALLVGDVSHLCSPMLAAIAWGGFDTGAIAVNNRASVQVVARAPGGCYVKEVRFSRAASTSIVWQIDDTDPLAVDPVAGTSALQNMGPTDLQSVVRYGESTVSIQANTLPRSRLGQASEVPIIDGFYLTMGKWLTFQVQTTESQLRGALLVQDAPTQAPIP